MVMMTADDVAAHKDRIDDDNRENYMVVAGIMRGGQFRFLVEELKMLYGSENARQAVSQ